MSFGACAGTNCGRNDIDPTDTRLVPVSVTDASAVPLRFTGPAMLRGLALADGLAVVPPGGGVVALGAGQRVEVLTV
jgi:molybdopterin molybdotransferase